MFVCQLDNQTDSGCLSDYQELNNNNSVVNKKFHNFKILILFVFAPYMIVIVICTENKPHH
ncbi:hypothetical protein BLA29_013737 [Euroglyphus maynei]|uniref:Uncharacterized protein n=1 Tax=Euroglyphus maynei TaxID=6958 RepID=A0A1Y3BEV3_EURMA|nr:hypothetical protein BLA29_013737 [Euroglyphus maynei]